MAVLEAPWRKGSTPRRMELIGRGNLRGLNNWELYDLEADRTERVNLAQKYPDRLKQTAGAWRGWAKRMG